jgi:hypothetical protein
MLDCFDRRFLDKAIAAKNAFCLLNRLCREAVTGAKK